MRDQRTHRTPRARWLLATVSALAISAACSPAGPRQPLSGPVPEALGRLVYAEPGGALWSLEPATKHTESFAALPAGSYVGHLAISPDGTGLAYSGLIQDPQRRSGSGADLFVMDLASRRSSLVAEAFEDDAYTQSAWSPDGRMLYVTRVARGQPPHIERMTSTGTARTTIVTGHSPTVAPDGRLGYLTGPRDRRQTLWVADAAGQNPRRVVSDKEFQALAAPRFAPDAPRIVFAAVGDPRKGRDRGEAPDAPGWLRIPVAHAHGGPPWDLWLINADGSGLRRLTNLREDYLVPTWSPDGRWIAFVGELGVYLFEFKTERLLRLTEQTSTAGLAWIGGTR